jgi:hypothetical protein
MSRLLAATLMTAIFPLITHAQGDPLASPDCQAARAELEQALNDADSSRGQASDRLARARVTAAAACLGGNGGGRERSGAPQPAQAVPPPFITQGRSPALPKLEPAPAPPAIPRPTIITTCDASGCWDSEGRRLNNAGPVLMGPRGLCSGTAGNSVSCP